MGRLDESYCIVFMIAMFKKQFSIIKILYVITDKRCIWSIDLNGRNPFYVYTKLKIEFETVATNVQHNM